MKPQTPEELYADNQDLADEGMLFIGDKGKILCDFRATRPRLIPESRQRAFEGSIPAPEFDTTTAEEEWVTAIKKQKPSRGSFEDVAPLGEAVTLANIALRVPYKRLLWDAKQMAVHQLARGQQTRPPRANPSGMGIRRRAEAS